MRMTGVSLHSPVCRDAGLGNQGPGMAGLPILLWLDLRIASTSGPMEPESRREQAAFFILSSLLQTAPWEVGSCRVGQAPQLVDALVPDPSWWPEPQQTELGGAWLALAGPCRAS